MADKGPGTFGAALRGAAQPEGSGSPKAQEKEKSVYEQVAEIQKQYVSLYVEAFRPFVALVECLIQITEERSGFDGVHGPLSFWLANVLLTPCVCVADSLKQRWSTRSNTRTSPRG